MSPKCEAKLISHPKSTLPSFGGENATHFNWRHYDAVPTPGVMTTLQVLRMLLELARTFAAKPALDTQFS